MTQQLCGETTCDDTLAQGRTCMSPKVLQSMRHWFSPQQHRTRSMLEFVHTHNEYVVQHGVERVNNRHVCHIFTARMGPRFSLQYNLHAVPIKKNSLYVQIIGTRCIKYISKTLSHAIRH